MADEEPIRNEEGGDLHQQPPPQDGDPAAGRGMVSLEMRPVFLGNLKTGYSATGVTEIFTRPIGPRNSDPEKYCPLAVDRVDLKRGYCFVFLKDATSQAEKDSAERLVSDINGM